MARARSYLKKDHYPCWLCGFKGTISKSIFTHLPTMQTVLRFSMFVFTIIYATVNLGNLVLIMVITKFVKTVGHLRLLKAMS